MINFFRRIRQNYLNQGKVPKYFKYAIGEIFLVMIGILLALQVNNWNNARINAQKEISILYELKEEYLDKLDELDQKVNLRNLIIDACNTLFDYIEKNDLNVTQDSITKYVAYTIIPPTFNASNSVTDELLNTGNLYLIQNKQLRKLVTSWKSELTKMTEEEQVIQTILIHNYYPYITKKIPYKDLSFELLGKNNDALKYIFKNEEGGKGLKKSKFKINSEALINDLEFENQVAGIFLTNLSANIQSETLRKHINLVLELTDKEIESKDL